MARVKKAIPEYFLCSEKGIELLHITEEELIKYEDKTKDKVKEFILA